MANQIEFISLLNHKNNLASCYLLRYENVQILLDCGWSYGASKEDIMSLQSVARNVDVVLLSSNDISHIGAYPYLFSHSSLTCSVYATFPLVKMGHLLFYDWYQSIFEYRYLDFSLDDIDSAIEHIKEVKYSQKIYLKAGGYVINVTAFPSGVTVGGSIWFIEIDGGDTRIVYAPNMNHQNDRHLNCISLNHILKPTVFITSTSTNRQFLNKATLEQNLINSMRATICEKGSVILVTDTAGRCLELLLLIAELHTSKFMQNINYFFVNHVASHVVESAKFQLEWMNENLLKSFQANSKNPFEFNFLKICQSIENIEIISSSIYIISDVCLEGGYGFKFLVEFCQNPRNKIIFTKSCETLTNLHSISCNVESFQVETTIRCFDPTSLENIPTFHIDNDSAIDDTMEFSDDDPPDVTSQSHSIFKLIKPKIMFQNIKDQSQYDSYGQIVKPEDFITLILGPNIDNQVFYQNKKIKEALDHKKIDPSIIPHTFNHISVKYQRNAVIEECILDGIADTNSLITLIKMIDPNILIIVGGTYETSQYLQDASVDKLKINKVYMADHLPSVTIIDERKSLKVRVQNQLLSALNFVDYADQQVAWIDFNPRKPSDSSSLLDCYHSLDLPDDFYNKMHKSVYLNELKFPELCQALTEKGYKVSFDKGVLTCNGGDITIQRLSTGNIKISARLSNDYFNIRHIVYQQLSII